jgi:hypothetical protein
MAPKQEVVAVTLREGTARTRLVVEDCKPEMAEVLAERVEAADLAIGEAVSRSDAAVKSLAGVAECFTSTNAKGYKAIVADLCKRHGITSAAIRYAKKADKDRELGIRAPKNRGGAGKTRTRKTSLEKKVEAVTEGLSGLLADAGTMDKPALKMLAQRIEAWTEALATLESMTADQPETLEGTG